MSIEVECSHKNQIIRSDSRMGFSCSRDTFGAGNLCQLLLVLGLFTYLTFMSLFNLYLNKTQSSQTVSPAPTTTNTFPPTNISHLIFGLVGSESAWHHRKAYAESWWRPNTTRGILYLETDPSRDLLPWSTASPPYRISDNLTDFLQESKALHPVTIRIVHGIMEVLRDIEDNDNFRWLIIGDDDSIFFLDNMVDVLGKFDHTEYYYIGGQSEFIMSNYWFSFDMGFGGAGVILSYPLAKALVNDMHNCLRRNVQLKSADLLIMVCIADLGVDFSPLKGLHQVDLHGDISGFLSYHPKFPLMSLHHLDTVDPIFPNMDRFESTRHLMKAAAVDQSRLLQQTICYDRQMNWSFSISWGYSVHIYERIMPRSYLMNPIETFNIWYGDVQPPPQFTFNTRLPSHDPCESPHVFFFNKLAKISTGILTSYSRVASRGLPLCTSSTNRTADFVSQIRVLSSKTKRKEMYRCECCDVVRVGAMTKIKFRECMIDEIIA